MNPLELWGGVECTVNRVGDRWFSQMERCGHAHRVDDLERIAALGVKALRYPVLWERHAPHRVDQCDWSWPDTRLERLRQLGIAPIVGLLHHGSGPAYTSLVDDRFPELLAAYARATAERYPWVTAWTPVNEPLTTARFSGLYGHWYPHDRSPGTFVRALLNQLRGVVLSMHAIRAVNPAARLIQTEDLGRTSGVRRLRAQVEHERQRRWLTWDLLTGRVDEDHPMRAFLVRAGATERELAFFRDCRCPPDVVGINYYVTSDRWLDDRLELYPERTHGGNGQVRYADVEAVRASANGLVGFEEHLVSAWNRYGLPLAITEAHMGCGREGQVRWLHEAWTGALAAQSRGADVRAVASWALLGSHDWDSLVTRVGSHYEPGAFDVRGPSPRPTAVAAVARQLATGGGADHPVLAGEGWWRRPERVLYGALARDGGRRTAVAAPPVLIVGTIGTLGRAFHAACTERGLAAHFVGHGDVDLDDPAAVDAIVRRVRPWAVINATRGRCGGAERDAERCRREVKSQPLNLAAACRRHRLPLVAFSSDLVFDGSPAARHSEQDHPSPISQYGRWMAEAEARIQTLLPSAMIVRPGPLFGPLEAAGLARRVVQRAERGEAAEVGNDAVVSPTYVAHLVHTTIDLLIDGECGIWHLANVGAVTWTQFARLLADPFAASASVEEGAGATPGTPSRSTVLHSVRATMMPPLDAAVGAFIAAHRELSGARACASS
jgi:dTDP-4-dehydrorhamnose reductase